MTDTGIEQKTSFGTAQGGILAEKGLMALKSSHTPQNKSTNRSQWDVEETHMGEEAGSKWKLFKEL